MLYTIPADTRHGHVHLKVADVNRPLAFYRYLLGFTITKRYGSEAVFLAAGNYHHQIGLNTWESKNAPPFLLFRTGLYHYAILYSTRKKLAKAYQQLLPGGYLITVWPTTVFRRLFM